MREFKFRVYNGKWMIYFDFKSRNVHRNLDKGYEIMQFTGLLDKNGIEIYESDILEIDDYNYKMIFYNGCFLLDNYNNGDYYQGADPLCTNYNKAFIIGNIHENPELL